MSKKKSEKAEVNPESIEIIVESDDQESPDLGEKPSASEQQSGSIEDRLREEVLNASQELAELNESYLRAAAELQNLRKRNAAELEKARKYAIDSFAKSLLEVMESLDKACELDDATDITAMREGVELTRKQLLSVFERASIKKIEVNPGDSFNVNEQEAMTMVPTADLPPNRVVEVFRPGYMIHDRLLRAAMVIVSAEPQKAEKPDSSGEAESEGSEDA